MTDFHRSMVLSALLRASPIVSGKHDGSLALGTLPFPSMDADWASVVDFAIGQKLGPLAAAALRRFLGANLGSDLSSRLSAIERDATRRALLQFSEVLRIKAHLSDLGIPILVFKGQVLAQQAYGNTGLRQCSDVDLFVHEHDLLRVKRTLFDLGYRAEWSFLPHQEADLLRTECEYTFVRSDGCMRIDLQWRPRARFFSFPLSPDVLWARAQRMRVHGFEIDTFSTDDLVLLLVVHGAKHTWDRLEQVCALAALINRHPTIDWDWIERTARSTGTLRMLWVAFHLVSSEFQAALPPALAARAVADSSALRLAGEFKSRWTTERKPLSAGKTFVAYLRLRERPVDRLRLVFWTIFTPTVEDWLQHPFPARFHWVHYLYRPWRLLCKYAFGWK